MKMYLCQMQESRIGKLYAPQYVIIYMDTYTASLNDGSRGLQIQLPNQVT